jgi:NAD(P)-dependent dehydrogenase (short-subunit alcohol dehydrogenase family)
MSKTIVISGANGNLGAAVVKKFLDSEYKVIAADNASINLGFAEGNSNFQFVAVNLTDERSATEFVRGSIDKNGKIDAALLLVGGFSMGDINTADGEALKKMYSLNFETAYFLARPLFQHMLKNAFGRIVLIGARPALKPSQGKKMIAYALSKSLLFRLAEYLNEEAKGKNVTISVVVPSTIDTSINRKSMPDADPADWVKPEQLAGIMNFICSNESLPVREGVYKVYNNS